MSETWRLFRFRRIGKYLRQEIEYSELFCADPDKLNDPFDCTFSLSAAIERVLEKSLDDERRSILTHLLGEFSKRHPADRINGESRVGVCCFSDTWNIPVMWSHYARNHTGICLRYEFEQEYFVDRYPIPSTDGKPGLLGIAAVSYCDNAFSEWLENGELMSGDDRWSPIQQSIQHLLSSKSEGWGVEREARLVMSGECAVPIEADTLQEVIFGMRTKPRNKALFAKLALKRNPAVALSQVTADPESDFGLMLKPYIPD